jgi:hypothetical protein
MLNTDRTAILLNLRNLTIGIAALAIVPLFATVKRSEVKP